MLFCFLPLYVKSGFDAESSELETFSCFDVRASLARKARR